MSEPTLALRWQDFAGEVGLFLGFGRGAYFGDPEWETQQEASIESCVRSGLRSFYYPPAVEGTPSCYSWSFLTPVATLHLASGAHTIALPDDFGGFQGNVTVNTTTTASQPWVMEWRSAGHIRQLYTATPAFSGRPMFLSNPYPLKGTEFTRGQRFEMILYPLADAAYDFSCTYNVNPDFLTGAFPYAYGGAQHAETILESCLAIAENRLDDASTIHSAKFKERLVASISLDRRMRPQKLGPNLDRSDNTGVNRRGLHWFGTEATYAGQSFDP